MNRKNTLNFNESHILYNDTKMRTSKANFYPETSPFSLPFSWLNFANILGVGAPKQSDSRRQKSYNLLCLGCQGFRCSETTDNHAGMCLANQMSRKTSLIQQFCIKRHALELPLKALLFISP